MKTLNQMEPHDSVIKRLEKDLERRKEKLDKKPTRWNRLQWMRTKGLLEQWTKERETKAKS